MIARIWLYVVVVSCLTCCSKPKDMVVIKFDRSGCFGGEVSEMILYKEQDSLIVKLKTEGDTDKQTKVGEGYFPMIPLFIKELKQLNDKGGCTTSDTYSVYVNGETIRKVDNGCKWEGFDKLKNAFFPSQQ
jgi:hypothetical protein